MADQDLIPEDLPDPHEEEEKPTRPWIFQRYTWEAVTRTILAFMIVGGGLGLAGYAIVKELEQDGMALGAILTLAATVATHYFKSTD